MFSFVLVQVTELLDAAEVIIVPVVNPDGYMVRRIGIYHEYAQSLNFLTLFFSKFKGNTIVTVCLEIFMCKYFIP